MILFLFLPSMGTRYPVPIRTLTGDLDTAKAHVGQDGYSHRCGALLCDSFLEFRLQLSASEKTRLFLGRDNYC